MYSHMMVGSNDIDRSKKFYDATFKAIVTKPIDGSAATHGNGSTVGFAMASPEQADAWHKAGVEAGGEAIEDAPGERVGSGFYLAYLRDPDGNKLCALHNLG
jgi:catechol 2,3-dioxygenase-like lactoylglutathione lyase family enzyme